MCDFCMEGHSTKIIDVLILQRNYWCYQQEIVMCSIGMLNGKVFWGFHGNSWCVYCSGSQQHKIKCSLNVPMGCGIMVFILIGNHWCAQWEVMCSTGQYLTGKYVGWSMVN